MLIFIDSFAEFFVLMCMNHKKIMFNRITKQFAPIFDGLFTSIKS